MGIWELLTTSEEDRRRRAREAFQAGMMQPQIFQTQDFPIEQMAPAYQKGYGMPYPTRQMPNPTAGMQGMTFDPNRGQQVEQPANLPIEYVQPRSAMEMATNQANIAGSGLAETKLSELEGLGGGAGRIRGYFDDLGADPDEYDIAGLGGFGRIPQGEQPEKWGPIQYDKYGQAYSIEETTGEPKSLWGAPTSGSGTGSENEKRLETALTVRDKASITIERFRDRVDPQKLAMMKLLGLDAMNDPDTAALVKGRLTPQEQYEIMRMMQQISWANQEIQGLTMGGQNADPLGIR